ncbi:hypothetical protein [Parachryseolinea silvisoli]|uniref:hypothetical protein n=1 Tax=Parachryseolinea silvisoli TaxID=2873601 RepID=UPI002265F6FC|nr:hypothetical protein [Parachryseolinea silvisoli]MCD9018420.1 hypothetical protein [Parachryseolinea silvisoli]
MKKINKFLLLVAFSAAAFSCSKDDDATPEKSLEDVAFSMSGSSSVVTPPSAMASSDDTYAIQATSYVNMANAMSGYLQYFKPPQGSVKSSTPITVANGRVAATQTEYLVYTWTDSQGSGMSIAYQVSEQSDKYVFEIFIKYSQDEDWTRYVYAEETKDGSEGLMHIYGVDDVVFITYSWKHTGDNFDFVISSIEDETAFEINIHVNTKTKAGSVEYVMNDELLYKMEWDAAGNGTWAYYVEGEVEESGSWEV